MANSDQIDRQSISTTLEQRYNAASNINSGGNNAKTAGVPGLASTNAVDQQNNFQNDFKAQQRKLETMFTQRAQKYADELGVQTTKYAPSGRIP